MLLNTGPWFKIPHMKQKTEKISKTIIKVLNKHPTILIAFLFGSHAKGTATITSDVDIAIAGKRPLSSNKIERIRCELAAALKTDQVDIVDLNVVYGTIFKESLSQSKFLFAKDQLLYASLIKKMWFNQADDMYYYFRTLKEIRTKWLKQARTSYLKKSSRSETA